MKHIHPGIVLGEMMNERNLTQRDLASKINIALSLLNNILNQNRNINIPIALALEAANFGKANYWLETQMKYSLEKAQSDEEIVRRTQLIKNWNDIDGKWIPTSYFRRKQELGISSFDDLEKIYAIYGVNDMNSLKKKIQSFKPTFFRKSSKFNEIRENVIAWSVLAEYLAKDAVAAVFNPSNEIELIEELKSCFYKNQGTLNKTKSILNKYGIKFFILDRPDKTPVEGKSFISKENPAIVLTLRYKRLDHFAFTIMHELGHVFLHLNKSKYKNADFFVSNSDTDYEELQANVYARNHLIELEKWNDFILTDDFFTDEAILKFSKQIKVHPGIIRGRVCFENNQFYSRRSSITKKNILK